MSSHADLAQRDQCELDQLKQTLADLKARHEASQAELTELRLARDKFQVAFELSPVSVSIVRISDQKIIEVNEGFCKLTGWSALEAIGKTSNELGLWADDSIRDRVYRQLKVKGSIDGEILRYKIKNGTYAYGLTSAKVIEMFGEPHILFVAKDAGQMVETNERLQLQESRTRALLDAPSSINLLMDKAGTVIEANRMAVQLFGHELQGSQLWDKIEPTQVEAAKERFKKAQETGESQSGIVDWNGRWYDRIFYPIGTSGEVALVLRDVTQAQRAKIEITNRESKYRMLFETMLNGYILFDVILGANNQPIDFRFVETNRAHDKIFGVTESRVGQLLSQFASVEGTNFKQMLEVVLTGKPARFQVYYPSLDRQIEYYGLCPKPGQYACVLVDVTEREKLIRELAQAKQAAEAAVEAKSRFLAVMSHEIRTPLNGILGMASLLEQAPLNEEQTEFVHIINQCGESLLAVINDILDFTKLESAKIKLEKLPVDLHLLIEEAFTLSQTKAAEKGLELIYRIDKKVPLVVIGDPIRLRQILNNLLDNAIKFSDGGDVLVRIAAPNPATDSKINLEFSVEDKGIGIALADQARLFKAFTQLDASNTRKYPGTGLGLAISQQLIELMGGNLGVNSDTAKGATFYFNLPCEVGQAELASIIRRPSPHMAGKRVLYFDYDLVHQIHWAQVLEESGFLVTKFQLTTSDINQLGPKDRNALILFNLPRTSSTCLKETSALCAKVKELELSMVKMGFLNYEFYDRICPSGILISKPIRLGPLFEVMQQSLGVASGAKAVIQTLDKTLGSRLPMRILVAEDNELNQTLILKLLEKMGYSAALAEDGKEAIEKISQERYDMILLDIQMPEMDGMEVTQHLMRNLEPRQRPFIVAMTANAMRGDREKYLDAGMDDYVSKPIDPYALQDLLGLYAAQLHNE